VGINGAMSFLRNPFVEDVLILMSVDVFSGEMRPLGDFLMGLSAVSFLHC